MKWHQGWKVAELCAQVQQEVRTQEVRIADERKGIGDAERSTFPGFLRSL